MAISFRLQAVCRVSFRICRSNVGLLDQPDTSLTISNEQVTHANVRFVGFHLGVESASIQPWPVRTVPAFGTESACLDSKWTPKRTWSVALRL